MGTKSRHITSLALLSAIGLVLFIIESYIPRPLPWAKPGLANIVTILAIYLYDLKTALIVVLIRVLVGALLIGTFLSPAFFLSLFGATFAAIAMGFIRKSFGKLFSVSGVSIFGALIHNTTQLGLAYLLIVNNVQIFYILPMMLLPAVVTGLVVGLVSLFLLKQIEYVGIGKPHWYAPTI